MAPVIRAVAYAVVFVGVLLILLPARLLEWSGAGRPSDPGALQWAGAAITVTGAAFAAWCVLAFALVGRGTPAPFDPPRKLVVAGPYRYVRNPMYLGAAAALSGAALFYGSLVLLAVAAAFALATHVFVVLYEEPTLRRTFGTEYETYCAAVRRWLPRRPEDHADNL